MKKTATKLAISSTSMIERQVEDLKPHPRNSRTHDAAQIRQLVESIQTFGWTRPLLIDSQDQIIAGHGSWMAAKQMGRKSVPTVCLAHLSPEQVRAYVIADNKLAEQSGWDKELLRAELGVLQELGFSLQAMGFDENEADRLLAAGRSSTRDPDDAPPLSLAAVTQPGEIWQLGEHRVMCGDARELTALTELLAGESVDCVWTDPPYNVNYGDEASMLNGYDKGHRITSTIENDHLSPEAFYQFLLGSFTAMHGACSAGAPIYVCHAETGGQTFRRAFVNAGFYLSSCLIWVKNALVLSRSDYHWQHEPILYGWKEGDSHRWYAGRDQTSIHDLKDAPIQQTKPDEIQVNLGEQVAVIRGQGLSIEMAQGTLTRENKPTRSAEHPTMKPVALIARHLRNSTELRDIVLDPFGGSGSTLMACEQTGRHARLLELVPHYCDVIVRRWQAFTGRPAIHGRSHKRFDTIEKERA